MSAPGTASGPAVPRFPDPPITEPIPVLLWHAVADRDDDDAFRVSREQFLRHLDLVQASGRTPLTATEYAEALQGLRPMPRRPILLTFDDGFADLADFSLPRLLERGLTATAFLTSGYIGRPEMLDAAGLAQVAALPGVEIGAHTVSHPHLDVLTPRREQGELADARAWLEDRVQRPVTSLAYPHGSHSRRTVRAAARTGYRTAHAVKNALSHRGDDVLSVARFTICRDTPTEAVARVVQGSGAPLGWRRERVRTWGFRQVRRARWYARGVAR